MDLVAPNLSLKTPSPGSPFQFPALDLLLHLIRVNELSVFEVDLHFLTLQYLEYLRLMEFSDIKEAASFIEMAASLVEIKSRRLIPTACNEDEQKEEKLEEEETEESLRQRLFLYDQFKSMGEHFAQFMITNAKTYPSQESKRLTEFYDTLDRPLQGDSLTLVILYEQMLAVLGDHIPKRVSLKKESIPIEEVLSKVGEIIDRLQLVLFEKLYEKIDSRYELVAYILAALQLVRDRQAKIIQERLLGPMWLCSYNIDKSILDHNQLVLAEREFSDES